MAPLRTLGNLTQNLWGHALATLLPPTCLTCQSPLPATEPVGLCPTCYGQLPFNNPQLITQPRLPSVIHSFGAPLLYHGPARSLILALKFADHTHHAQLLAKLMAPHLPPNGTLLMPVPMHRSRLFQRTFNQAALLAQALGQLTQMPVDVHSFQRLIASDGQVSRTRAQRLRLSSRHFHAPTQAVKGHHIILIDDILTTGSTARACALALRRAGASSVSVLTACLTTHQDLA